ncbi:MAG: phosphate acyltransferase PlsX [Candidatus Ozemobacteraceae bacterium]
MKIALDVMGGDFAPRELVLGAKAFAETGKAGVLLVGRESDIRAVLPELPPNCEIVDTNEFVEMGEAPAHALRKKKNASVALAARLVKQGIAQAFVSAGSTGAQMAASLMEIGRIPGIERPAPAVVLPTTDGGGCVVLDMGANVDCKPAYLLQFALMGAAYSERIFSRPRPRIGLLNVGSEEGKGNELAKAVFPLLKDSGLNFVGNVEADHLFEGIADVVVCDGFVGNVLLKASEGISEAVVGAIKAGMKSANLSKEAAGIIFAGLRRYQSDAPEYSGAPLLGIAGPSIVCHGKSKAPVIAHALQLAAQYAETDVLGLIARNLELSSVGASDR